MMYKHCCIIYRYCSLFSVNAVLEDADLVLDPKMPPPNDLQAKLLRQVVLGGLADHIAR